MHKRREGPGPVAILSFESLFIDAVEIGHEAEEVVLRNRVELVVVAAGATDGHAQDRRAISAHAIHGIFHKPLLPNGASLVVDPMVAVERGGDLLIEAGIREEVAGELLGQKLVIGHVRVEGVDHPIAPRPTRANHLVVDGVAIAVAGDIEPINGHALAVVG